MGTESENEKHVMRRLERDVDAVMPRLRVAIYSTCCSPRRDQTNCNNYREHLESDEFVLCNGFND